MKSFLTAGVVFLAGAVSVTSVRSAEMVAATKPLQCVPYARALSGLPIRGDAWTWWLATESHYRRGPTPRVGSVLVLRRTDRLRRGHLAVVTRVLGPRKVLAEHANWLNRGMIHRNVPLIDVSPANDWSQVRFWNVPGNHLGVRAYPAHGFIYPVSVAASASPHGVSRALPRSGHPR